MAQRGIRLYWGGRGRRNAGPRRANADEYLKRIEALEARLKLDDSEEEQEDQRPVVGAVDPMERLIQAVSKQGSKPKVDLSDFKGELNPDLFLDWIQELEKYFEMEDLGEDNPKRVKIATSKLKSHAGLWWDNLQSSRRRQGKEKIRLWPKMLKHLLARFMPSDYQQKMFKEFQNLRQRDQSIQSYTEQFMRLQIRTDLQESNEQAAARYINGLKYQLQDELALVKLHTVDEAYEYASKAEEKLIRKNKMSKKDDSFQNRGRGSSSKPVHEEEPEGNNKYDFKGRGNYRGRGRGRQISEGWKPLKCYICNEPHKAIDCPHNPKRAMVALEEDEEPPSEEVEAEVGENLMLQRALVSGDKESPEADWRRKSIFRTNASARTKCAR